MQAVVHHTYTRTYTRVGKKSGLKIWSSVTDLENGSLSLAFSISDFKELTD